MSVIYYTPEGEDISTLRGRIQAVGVALLFTYSVHLHFNSRSTSYVRDFSHSFSNHKARTKLFLNYLKLPESCICLPLQVFVFYYFSHFFHLPSILSRTSQHYFELDYIFSRFIDAYFLFCG